MSAPLRRVLVRRPARHGDWAAAGWREPDPALLVRQHEDFCALLERLGVEVEVRQPIETLVDAVYVHDPVMITGAGAIPLSMRKPIRSEEPLFIAADLEQLGVPIVGRLPEGAWADGGDRFWLDDRTMALGMGYRTNPAGVAALAELVAKLPRLRPQPERARFAATPEEGAPLGIRLEELCDRPGRTGSHLEPP